ncbi:MAG: MATE family efflux transporter [Candidatus Hydrogenedentes bacterium]|jgi:putative MATE family efflux protein|nr:MATE family efflux transporter [Candidatus Hydrogenedentota bacterium]
MHNKKIKELNSHPIPSLIWRYFWPSFVGIMANSLYNIVDRIFIGHAVGAEALSGVTAVFPIMIIMTAFGMLIGVGASTRISLALGSNEKEKAQQILGNALVLVILLSIMMSVVGFLIKGPMLRLFGASDVTSKYANEYLNYILLGAFLHHLGFSLNGIIRAEGNARVAMYSMLISAGVNIPLDALFILHWKMGVQGAAIATILSMAVLSVWVLVHFNSKRCVVPLERRYIRIQWKIVVSIISIGVSPFLMQAANSVVQGLFNINLIKFGGDLAVGAMGIINSVVFLVIMSIIALNMATQPIIGYNYGARNFLRVKESLKIALAASTLISIISWIFIQAFPELIVNAFVSGSPEILSIGVHGMRLFLLFLPIVGFQVVAGNYFQSVGKAGTAIFLTLLRQVIILIPVLLVLAKMKGLEGVWLAAPLADSISAFICAFILIQEWKQISRRSLVKLD